MNFFRWNRPDRQPPLANPDCKHLNTHVGGINSIGYGTCADCQREVNLAIVFTNWIEEFKALRNNV